MKKISIYEGRETSLIEDKPFLEDFTIIFQSLSK